MYLCHLRLQHSDFPDWYLTVAELMMNRLTFTDDYPPSKREKPGKNDEQVGVGVGVGVGENHSGRVKPNSGQFNIYKSHRNS